MCKYCGGLGYHEYRCPNYETPPSKIICDYCGEGILDGEEYIENQDGEYMHYECVQGIRHLLGWLGYDIKEMSDYD